MKPTFAALLVFTLCACSDGEKEKPSPDVTDIPKLEKSEPLDPGQVATDSFKEVLRKVEAKVGNRFQNGQHSYVFRPGVRFDVKKSDSLVTPFTGEIVVPLDLEYDGDFVTSEQTLQLAFGYSDNQWEVRSGARFDSDGIIGSPTVQADDRAFWVPMIEEIISN